MTIEDIKPKSTAVLRGDDRTLQYYCLRIEWKWELSHKTRSTTEAMQIAWSHDIDIVTMLGMRPQPVKRDWRRYDEMRELVDAGRSKKAAQRILDALQSEAQREERLRYFASSDLLSKFEKRLQRLIDKADECRERFAKRISGRAGAAHLGHAFDEFLSRDLICTYAGELLKAVVDERDRDKKQAALKMMLKQQDTIQEHLVEGVWEVACNDTNDAVKIARAKAARDWLGKLRDVDYADKHGFIVRYRAWENAKETLSKRRVTDVADKLKMLGKLGKLG